MTTNASLLWLRHDLRLADNLALHVAVQRGGPVIPVCIWTPKLSRLPAAWIHKPWEAPTRVFREAGVKLGTTYPGPIVEHHSERIRALAARVTVKKGHRHAAA